MKNRCQIPLRGRGIFGIEAAAQTFFGKSASDLSLEEATRLAAVIPSPLRHRPDQDSRYVLRRKQIVLGRMEARNFIHPTVEKEDSTDTLMQMPDSNTTDEGDENGL